jgi:anion-transporting  ArsA/GET3 family ATPase
VHPSEVWDRRLLLVSGKGGVGKSTLAGALALAAARAGRRTCLIEVEGRQTFSNLFETAPWGFDEREFRPGLHGLSIDPEASLTEYLAQFYGAQRITRLVARTPAVEFATQAAPGIKDVLLIGKVKEVERRRRPDGRFAYDLVVVDAPPTGRIVGFLAAPDATTELVPVGPVRQQAQTVVEMLTDRRRTALLLATLLEEMPVTETVEGVAALGDLGVPLGPVLVNRVAQAVVDPRAAKAMAALEGADVQRALGVPPALAAELLAFGDAHRSRLALQDRMRERLAGEAALPSLELPDVPDAARGGEVVQALADLLGEALAGDRRG